MFNNKTKVNLIKIKQNLFYLYSYVIYNNIIILNEIYFNTFLL